MAPPHLNLDAPTNDLDHATSPAINIQTADRFPASPWNEYDTDWKFPAPAPDVDARNSNPYTPSYNGSFNSWGSHSVSWGGRENSDPMNLYEDRDFLMEDSTASRRQRDEEYNPTHYDGDIVGDMELEDIPAASFGGNGPQLSFTPAFESFGPPEHSPAFSGASASSPGSDIDLNNSNPRSRASSTSSLHRPNPSASPPSEISHSFNTALSFNSHSSANPSFSVETHPPSPPPPLPSPGIKPHSPPALVIPGEDGGLAPPQNPHAPGSPSPSTARPGLSAPGVSIHIVPSTPVGGVEVQGAEGQRTEAPYQQLMEQGAEAQQSQDQRFSGPPPLPHANTDPGHADQRSWGQTQSSTPGPGSHPQTPQFHSRTDSSQFHTHSRSGSSSHASSPAFSPRPMDFGGRIDFSRVPQTSTGVAFSHQHRSPALSSGTSSLHGSPLPGMQHLDLSPSPRPHESEFLLPDADPGVQRPRSSSERGARAWQDMGLGLGFPGQDGMSGLSLTGTGQGQGRVQGTVDPNDVLPPPDSAGSGREAFNQQAQYAPHPYDNPHLHPHTAAGGAFGQPSGSDTFLSPSPVSVRRVKSESVHVPTHRRAVKSEDLRVPPSQHLDFFPGYRGPGMSNLLAPPASSGLGLLNVSSVSKHHRRGHDRHSSLGSHGHASVRSSPYPSPNASPARGSHGLPDVGGMNVFDTYGATGAGPDTSQLNTTNPPRKLVTTKATHDASSARRKNEPGFVCPVPGCGSTFTRSFNLKGHLRSHNEERPFKCKWPGCEKGFARQHDCKRHEALHLNIRPYTCAGCKKTFARMDALNRHRGADCAQHEQPLQTMEDHHHQGGGRNNPSGDLGPGDQGLIM